jgi:hypothetical protein
MGRKASKKRDRPPSQADSSSESGDASTAPKSSAKTGRKKRTDFSGKLGDKVMKMYAKDYQLYKRKKADMTRR